MPGYKPQVKSENGDMVDIPIAATYDENGNRFTEKYVSVAAQTFTEEQKAQARANIGVAGGKVYRHCVMVRLKKESSSSGALLYSCFSFDVYLSTATPLTEDTIRDAMPNTAIVPTNGKYMREGDESSIADIAYVIFTTARRVTVYRYEVGTGISTVNTNTVYFQNHDGTVATVVDFVQEMP